MSGWNFSGIIVGPRGFGKTTLQISLIERHLRETNGIVVAHDPVMQFAKYGCAYYPDVAAWRAANAAAARERKPMPRGSCIGGLDSEAVTQLALELGEKMNTADRVAVPILVPYDEASLRDGSGSTHIGDLDRQMLSLARHRGVGPVFNLQEAKQLVAQFFRQATDVYLFRQTEDRARELDNLLVLEKHTLVRAGVTRLEKHNYLHVRTGEGIVDEPL